MLIAAGGLLAIFSLFPAALRQSRMSDEDLRQYTFASSLFEAISANLKDADESDIWPNEGGSLRWSGGWGKNPSRSDPGAARFWNIATRGTGLDDNAFKLKSVASGAPNSLELSKFSAATSRLFDKGDNNLDSIHMADLYYTGREINKAAAESETKAFNMSETELKLPPQFIIRVRQVNNNFSENRILSSGGAGNPRGPRSYIVSVVSSGLPLPNIYHNNAVYSQEFYFSKRP
jgi:hypothetical protein